MHSTVGDHSPMAHSEILPDEKRHTCAGFLLRRHGVDRPCPGAVMPHGMPAVDPPATAVGHDRQLLDVHVQQRARLGTLIAAVLGLRADLHPGGPVQVPQPVQPNRTSTACTVEAGIPSRLPSCCGPNRLVTR